eukprot:TRINITY_DN67611_c0_g1_i1.p1 TRINITY_DN67611_c0_g1~~TRINITY_DN67611_c0_g1_i1.p1  ORF type:complete len:399 (+),score=38.06 TRINITY_DN67611_c0_g1_i1:37-1233(+)
MKLVMYRGYAALVALYFEWAVVARRTHPSKTTAELTDNFGIEEMIVEKRSSSIPEAKATEEDVKSQVLNALAAVKLDPDRIQCPFTLEAILKDGKMVSGGLVAVVEEQQALAEHPEKPFRVHFSTLSEFRRWVQMKPVDIHTNKLFADEPLAWVLRLTDSTEESKEALPNLTEFRVVGRRNPFRTFIRSYDVRENPLMPGLVPQQGDTYTFKFYRQACFACTLRNLWKWNFVRNQNLRFDRAYDAARDGAEPVMVALGKSVGFNREWRVYSPGLRALFWLKAHMIGYRYTILSVEDRRTLFTISVPAGFGSFGTKAASVVIRQGDDGDVVYNGASLARRGNHLRFNFYHGATQETVAGKFMFEPYWQIRSFTEFHQTLEISEGVDTALLLVAAAILSN